MIMVVGVVESIGVIFCCHEGVPSVQVATENDSSIDVVIVVVVVVVHLLLARTIPRGCG